jgi:broad specificity phosphatase PhoE
LSCVIALLDRLRRLFLLQRILADLLESGRASALVTIVTGAAGFRRISALFGDTMALERRVVDGQEARSAASKAPTMVFLARHAEAAWNRERRFQGHGDSPLTCRGLEQAQRLAARLASEPLAAVHSSDLGRARHTAQIVAAPHGLEIRAHAGLREIDTGLWTGRLRSDVKSGPEWAALRKAYRDRPQDRRMPGGESLAEVQRRVLVTLREIARCHTGESIAVISHRKAIETVLAYASGLQLGLRLTERGGHCFLSMLEVTADACVPAVVYDGRHLDDLTIQGCVEVAE